MNKLKREQVRRGYIFDLSQRKGNNYEGRYLMEALIKQKHVKPSTIA
jgi:hypothetical protein